MPRWIRAAQLSGLLILLVAILLRCYGLGSLPGFHGDEAWHANQAADMASGAPFETRTPSDLFLNPLHTGLLALLQIGLPYTVWAARSAALLTGLLFLVLLYFSARTIFSHDLGRLVFLLGAALPYAILSSRIGWDVSPTPLATLLALHFALRQRWVLFGAAMVLCLIVHPTNIFLLPVALSQLLVVERDGSQAWRYKPVAILGLGLVVIAGTAGVIWLLSPTTFGDLAWPSVKRLTAPISALTFALEYIRLLSGTTIYAHFASGPSAPHVGIDVIGGGLLVAIAVIAALRLRKASARAAFSYLVGLGVAALGLYLVAGTEALQAPRERYGAFLVVPSLLGVGIVAKALGASVRRRFHLIAHATCWLLLFGFALSFLAELERSGGEAHYALRTATLEPKVQVLEVIRSDAGEASSVLVMPSGWWDGQPLRYLARSAPHIEVQIPLQGSPPMEPPRDHGGGPVYAVAYVDHPYDIRLRLALANPDLPNWTIRDGSDRPLLRVYRLAPP